MLRNDTDFFDGDKDDVRSRKMKISEAIEDHDGDKKKPA